MPHKPWAVGPKYRSVLSTAKFVFCINYDRLTFLLITTERPQKKCLYLQRDHEIPVHSICLIIINTGKYTNSLSVHVEKKCLNDYRPTYHITDHRVTEHKVNV